MSKHSVLVMEDDPQLLRLYSKALNKAGYGVCGAGNADQARIALENTSFDMILCDINLGDGCGTDVLRDYRLDGTPVIVVSGHEPYRMACEAEGYEFFLSKPVHINDLVTLVDRLAIRN